MPSLTASLSVSIAEAYTKTTDTSVAVAEPKSMTTGMQMRIIDQSMYLIGLNLKIVTPWGGAIEMADRNRDRFVRLLAEGDEANGVVLGLPHPRELHRTDSGVERCVGSSCELTNRRALTAVNFYSHDTKRLQILVCDEALTKKLAEIAEDAGGSLNRQLLALRRGCDRPMSSYEAEYEIEVVEANVGDSFWDMIDSLDLIDLESVSDDELVGMTF